MTYSNKTLSSRTPTLAGLLFEDEPHTMLLGLLANIEEFLANVKITAVDITTPIGIVRSEYGTISKTDLDDIGQELRDAQDLLNDLQPLYL